MEGLLLAAALARLAPRLPLDRLPWRFLGDAAVVLPLVPEGALVIDVHPERPRMALTVMPGDTRGPHTPFERALLARAAGPLVGASQSLLDRRCTLAFGASEGFVPTPPLELVVELTGRNANLVLVEPGGRIAAVRREVAAAQNRHRQLLPGLTYRPPPGYDKLDPRHADGAVIASALRGRPLRRAYERLDGIGTTLTRAWSLRAGVDAEQPLEGDALERALAALADLVADPEEVARSGGVGGSTDTADDRAAARRAELERAARGALRERRALLTRRVADAERALQAVDDAARLRAEADLLLARAHGVPRGATRAALEGFEGETVEVTLDPALDAAGNARRRYDQARRREARGERALAQHDGTQAALAAVDAQEAAVAEMDDDALRGLVPTSARPAARRAARPGLWLTGPHGYEIVIGRSARENDLVTFRVGRRDDIWLHAQGYHGAHVLVRSQGADVPFDVILFAAQLAAGHSEAGGSDNVPVDYAKQRHVWRVRGAPAGAVSYAQQKTVFVRPLRRSQVA